MKFEVYELGHVTRYIGEIEADSKEEAIEAAYDHDNFHGTVGLCHQCAREWSPGDTEVLADEIKESK